MHTTTPRTEARGSKKFYSDKASTVVARRVHSAESRLDALEREQVAKPPEPLRFKGFASRPAPPPGETLVDLQGVAVQGRLAPTDLVVHGTDRILLTGPNGSGKSTLLAVLVGSLAADAGARLVRGGTRIGLLAQEMRWPRPDRTVLDTYRDATSAVFPPPSLKATGLIAPRDLNRPLGSLSVGQQRRLELAVILADPPDILLLDEPTNHLSLALTEELEAALPDYPGAVIVATHDRWLRDRWPGPQVRIGSA
jgi:macrolide transport system ATP-binding/permease protein